jgi:hypothetical protein
VYFAIRSIGKILLIATGPFRNDTLHVNSACQTKRMGDQLGSL